MSAPDGDPERRDSVINSYARDGYTVARIPPLKASAHCIILIDKL